MDVTNVKLVFELSLSHTAEKNDLSAGGRHGGGSPHLESSLLTAIGQLEFERPARLSHYPWNQTCVGSTSRFLTSLSLSAYLLHPVLWQKAWRFKTACTTSLCALFWVFLPCGKTWEGWVAVKHLGSPMRCNFGSFGMWERGCGGLH